MLLLVNETTIYSSIQNIPYTGIQGQIEDEGDIVTWGPGKYEVIGQFLVISLATGAEARIQLDDVIMLEWNANQLYTSKNFTTTLEESANTVLKVTETGSSTMGYNVLYRSTPRLALASSAEVRARKEAQMEWWYWANHAAQQILKEDKLPGHYVYGGTADYHLEFWKNEKPDLFFKYQKLLKKTTRKAEKRKLASSLKNKPKSQ